jgi:hypothetical protein
LGEAIVQELELSSIMDNKDLSIPFHLGCFKKAFANGRINRVELNHDGIVVVFYSAERLPRFIIELDEELRSNKCEMTATVYKNLLVFH